MYVPVLVAQLKEGLISEDDLTGLSDKAKQYIRQFSILL